MISSPCYPYPVNDKSSVRRVALQPHIYSPSKSRRSLTNVMYPHLHASACPSPSYIYSGYEQYYSKDSWPGAAPSSWPTFYPFPSRSASLPENANNPKVTILPQPLLVSDIDTPSSISSHSVLTPSSPFAQHDVGEAEFQAMDFDEFDCEDEEDYFDSDFADEMEGVDDVPSSLYGASAPQVIKSTSALAGALGDTPSSSYDNRVGLSAPADRRLSASVPGYGSASHRSTATSHQRWSEKTHSPAPLTSSPHVPETSYPSQHTHTQRNYTSSSTSLLTPTSPSLYSPMSSSSSLAGAFASSAPSSFASRHVSNPLPILQPQPIRPIPPIPLADLTCSANESIRSPEPSRRVLSPLPLLCQPVSDMVRYQLKESSVDGNDGDACYDSESAPASTCKDLAAASENDQFAPQGMAFCREQHHHHHPSAGGTYASMAGKLYSCGCMCLPMRW